MKNLIIIHPEYGQLVNEQFDDEQNQHKIYLNAVHSALTMKNPMNMFNGLDNFVYIPYNILKECVIVGSTSSMTLGQYAVTKIKEGVI